MLSIIVNQQLNKYRRIRSNTISNIPKNVADGNAKIIWSHLSQPSTKKMPKLKELYSLYIDENIENYGIAGPMKTNLCHNGLLSNI